MVEERILVLCVDRDNDVGERLGVKTPVIGRDNVLKVGLDYIVRYPDDSDANAIFGAVKVYDGLRPIYGDNIEVALVTGSSGGDVEADLKVMAELDRVLSVFNADGIILVSDGPSDEVVLPLIQSRKTVVSVKRIVVKQTRSVEDFAVLSRYYIRKAFLDPEWRRYTLGLPGLIIALYGLWILIPQSIKPIIASSISLLLGLALLFIAFNAYRPLVLFIRRYEVTFFTILVTAIVMGMYINAYSTVLRSNPYPLLIGKPLTLPELLGIIYGVLVAVLVLETYTKTHRIPYGHIASISLISPLTGLSSIITPGFNIESLMLFLTIYILINILVLALIFLIRRHERRMRIEGRS
ncbi:MAG: DUF373 family protein [Caldivirga sp.]|jgi:Predicted membrane protein|uniref:DUF373 family protein n=1 Tax=Caldivirga sp. MU80 TaxID=1650354 RepID=UPI0007492A4C|nr:DUF373 family protein [Caldivirga sp. MU80]KUO91313.1 MAG: hypothetical protein AT713_04770 [Caldivirga sp. JCHS_4]